MTWDYAAAKKPCAICGGETSDSGMILPLCRTCELEWLASGERTERATARQRFVDRRKHERKALSDPARKVGT